MANQESPVNAKGLVGTLLLVFACFTLSSSGYLAWLYHLMVFVPPESVDALSMGAGYACQGLGLVIAAVVVRVRPESMGRVAFVALIALLFACSAPAALSDSLGGTLAFGYAMNLLIGVVSAFYLQSLAQFVVERRRGIVFGCGYACSVAASWLLTFAGAPFAGVPTELIACAAFSILAVIVGMVVLDDQKPGARSDLPDEMRPDASPSSESAFPVSASAGKAPATISRTVVALACITVLLMSMVKNMGFNFPTADIGVAVSLELSRLFYAVGLVIAGIVIDRNRKLGGILCMAALVVPFALIALSSEPMPSAVLWAVDYFFYGFFQVFRIVLFVDLAARSERLYLAGFGLMLGRFGDALGVAIGLSLGGSTVALVEVTAALFVACVFMFYQLFLQLYAPQFQPVAPERSERELFDAFAATYELSPREREMLRQVIDDKTNAEAAAALYVSESTVKFHMRNLLKKTGCKNRVELLAKYADEAHN